LSPRRRARGGASLEGEGREHTVTLPVDGSGGERTGTESWESTSRIARPTYGSSAAATSRADEGRSARDDESDLWTSSAIFRGNPGQYETRGGIGAYRTFARTSSRVLPECGVLPDRSS